MKLSSSAGHKFLKCFLLLPIKLRYEWGALGWSITGKTVSVVTQREYKREGRLSRDVQRGRYQPDRRKSEASAFPLYFFNCGLGFSGDASEFKRAVLQRNSQAAGKFSTRKTIAIRNFFLSKYLPDVLKNIKR